MGRDCLSVCLTVDVVVVIATRMAPLCQMIERLQSKVKTKQEGDVKKEDGPLTPSPAKKLATDMEKKLKNVPGDTRLVKESRCRLKHTYIHILHIYICIYIYIYIL